MCEGWKSNREPAAASGPSTLSSNTRSARRAITPRGMRKAVVSHVSLSVAAAPDGQRPATLVYIEDNGSNVRLMERMLAKRPGLTLRHLALGRADIAAVVAAPPDLVLLDMHLPDISGEEVLHELWTNPASRDVPVIVLSADATPGLPKRLKSAGARGFLSKPLNVRQVLSAIDDVLAKG